MDRAQIEAILDRITSAGRSIVFDFALPRATAGLPGGLVGRPRIRAALRSPRDPPPGIAPPWRPRGARSRCPQGSPD